MPDKTIVASFDDLQQAQGAVQALKQVGMDRQTISVAARDRSEGETARRSALSCPAARGLRWTGTLICAACGVAGAWIGTSLATLPAPGIGPVLVFGSLFSVLAALGGALMGHAIDRITASVTSVECVHTCTERLQRGDTVVAVSARRAETKRARAILSSHKAREIALVG
jgi:hypothetical protein